MWQIRPPEPSLHYEDIETEYGIEARDKQSDDHCREKKETARNRFRWPRPQHPPIAGLHLISTGWQLELGFSRRFRPWARQWHLSRRPLPFRRHDPVARNFGDLRCMDGHARRGLPRAPRVLPAPDTGGTQRAPTKILLSFTCE